MLRHPSIPELLAASTILSPSSCATLWLILEGPRMVMKPGFMPSWLILSGRSMFTAARHVGSSLPAFGAPSTTSKVATSDSMILDTRPAGLRELRELRRRWERR
eukprot:CAMPEP_0195056338 /NCGR_PEP_ID=MMETSP0448-20130528/4775_1 /TAXON_ID=66468 /ORGANISM="Heterocapsa triquestra, Strain CCMP 448" /LENGTH=103 /DNA_ID=CAMNT_0040086151 /DNA_START=237 /DNA_END=544 /DNA_ORIENTATION=+